MKLIKVKARLKQTKRLLPIILAAAVVLLITTAFAFWPDNRTEVVNDSQSKDQYKPEISNEQNTNQPPPSDTQASTSSSNSKPNSPTSPTTSPTIFGVSSIKLHDPQIIYNTDKLGNQHRACRVNAEVSVTAAGAVKYYWQTYHPEYYNPSSNGPEFSLEFGGAGTKTISLDTYVSDDERHFTLFIVSPNNKSSATADRVWCPTG